MTAEAWALEEVSNVLRRLREQGEGVVTAERIRGEVGIGHEDLTDVLAELRERGEISEEAPGEWAVAGEDDGEVGVSLSDAEANARAAMDRMDGKDRRRPAASGDSATPPFAGVPRSGTVAGATTRLTVGVADALDAETLGSLVKAGIEEAKQAGVAYSLLVDTIADDAA